MQNNDTAQKREWCYIGAVCKEHAVTRYQVIQAIKAGVIETKIGSNPYHRSSDATLVKNADIMDNLESIRTLPRYEQREDPLKKLRDVKCPICDNKCLPDQRRKKGHSSTAENFKEGDMSFNEAKLSVLINHIRHKHTRYDEAYNVYGMNRKKLIDQYRDDGLAYEIACELADEELGDEKPDYTAHKANAYQLLEQYVNKLDDEFKQFFLKHQADYKASKGES